VIPGAPTQLWIERDDIEQYVPPGGLSSTPYPLGVLESVKQYGGTITSGTQSRGRTKSSFTEQVRINGGQVSACALNTITKAYVIPPGGDNYKEGGVITGAVLSNILRSYAYPEVDRYSNTGATITSASLSTLLVGYVRGKPETLEQTGGFITGISLNE
jgi:hypothetical protein